MILPGVLMQRRTLKQGLISCWGFEETSGSTCYDSHGDNDMNISGATLAQNAGKLGNSYLFDGYNDYVRIETANNNLSPQVNHSISIWFKRVGNSTGPTGTLGGLVTRYYSSTGLCCFFTTVHDSDDAAPNRLRCYYYDTANKSAGIIYDPGSDIWTGNWRHVVWTRAGTVMKLYVDGTYISTNSGGNGLMQQSTNPVCRDYIGAFAKINTLTGDSFLYAYVTQVASWSKALSPTEISILYNSGNGLEYSQW